MSQDDVTRFARQPCPHCGKPLDAAAPPTRAASRAPRTGDFLLCFGCGQPAVYVGTPFGATLRALTGEELAEFAVDHGHHAERLRSFLADNP